MHAFQPVLSHYVHEKATYSCHDTSGCVMQFWPDNEHMCSKYVEAWNKLILKLKYFASISLITEIIYWGAARSAKHKTYSFLNTRWMYRNQIVKR